MAQSVVWSPLRAYVTDVAKRFTSAGLSVTTSVTGPGLSRPILQVAESDGFDLIALASHGRGGVER